MQFPDFGRCLHYAAGCNFRIYFECTPCSVNNGSKDFTKFKIFNSVLAFYISFIRGTPILVQIFLVYYVLPVFGINLGPFTAGIVAITLNSAAFVTEILRGGLASVPIGQFEAAKSSWNFRLCFVEKNNSSSNIYNFYSTFSE